MNSLIEMLLNIDRRLSFNLRQLNIKTRNMKSNGIWCVALLPTILVIYTLTYKVSPVFKITALTSIGLLFFSLLFLLFVKSLKVLDKNLIREILFSSGLTTILYVIFLEKGNIFYLHYSLTIIWTYNLLIKFILKKIPNAFTVGEALIVSQTVILYTVASLITIFDKSPQADINKIIAAFLFSICLMLLTLKVLKVEQRKLKVLLGVITIYLVFFLAMLFIIIGCPCTLVHVQDIIDMCLQRTFLFCTWASLVLATFAILWIKTSSGRKASTGDRKLFHILVSIVFITGILYDELFLKLAVGLVFGLMIFVEGLRKLRVESVSKYLQQAFLIYCDEKDSGDLALTPIYLFLGLTFPLWIVTKSGTKLELLSGVLSVGIGDTAASWFGSKFGVHKWPNSNRTIEGTICNILSQIIVVCLIPDILPDKYAVIQMVLAATVSSLVEAKIDQVDNLVLPLVYLITFQISIIATNFIILEGGHTNNKKWQWL